MTDHGIDLDGVIERSRKGSKKSKAALPPTTATQDLLPRQVEPKADWSLADPTGMDYLIRACQTLRDFDTAVLQTACPREIAEAFRRDPEWVPRFKQILHDDLLVKFGPAAAEEALTSGAYGFKVFLDASPKASMDDARAAELKALRRGGMKGRIKALDDLIRSAWRQREILSGGEYPPQQDIQNIILEVAPPEPEAAKSA